MPSIDVKDLSKELIARLQAEGKLPKAKAHINEVLTAVHVLELCTQLKSVIEKVPATQDPMAKRLYHMSKETLLEVAAKVEEHES